MISFDIPGNPMAWQRARRFGNRYFDSADQTSYKNLVILTARQSIKQHLNLIEGPISLKIDFYFKRPKAICKKDDCKKALRMYKRPDVDNCLKMIGDALNGIIWRDDALITEAVVHKWYHEIGGSPRTQITIEPFSEGV